MLYYHNAHSDVVYAEKFPGLKSWLKYRTPVKKCPPVSTRIAWVLCDLKHVFYIPCIVTYLKIWRINTSQAYALN